jgi:hypothetical protein
MGRLVINNHTTEAMVGDLASMPAEDRRYLGHQAQRMLWCLLPDDILVVPVQPTEAFVRYAAGAMRIDRSTWSLAVPPPGRQGIDLLLDDRLEDEGFVRQLRQLVRQHDVDRIFAFHSETAVAGLVRRLGLEWADPNHALVDQGGATLLSSKATYRTVAAGTRAPVADGVTTSSRSAAADFIWDLLTSGRCAIVKQEFNAGGLGNEILSPTRGVRCIGARHVEVVTDRLALDAYLADRWCWYTDDQRHRVVIEHYIPGCTTIYVELRLGDHSVGVFGHGEMRMKPVNSGLVVPCPSARLTAFPGFLDAARRLCEPVRAMGYRGHSSVDAIVTPDEEILLTEWNIRPGGSTHIHFIAEQVVGGAEDQDRVLIERRSAELPPIDETVAKLEACGIAYDPGRRRGVLVTVEGSPEGAFGECCVVAESLAEAEEIERRLEARFRFHDG